MKKQLDGFFAARQSLKPKALYFYPVKSYNYILRPTAENQAWGENDKRWRIKWQAKAGNGGAETETSGRPAAKKSESACIPVRYPEYRRFSRHVSACPSWPLPAWRIVRPFPGSGE
jgi:hypothetical protein